MENLLRGYQFGFGGGRKQRSKYTKNQCSGSFTKVSIAVGKTLKWLLSTVANKILNEIEKICYPLNCNMRKNRMVCKKFALSADILSSSTTTLQEKEGKTVQLEDYRFTYVQGSFRLFCKRKLDFSKSLVNNLESNVKKLTVSGSSNFTNDPNCLQVF